MKKISNILATSTLLLTFSGLANAIEFSGFYLEPYVGLDAQFRNMPFKTDFGSKNFRYRYPQANAYVGLKLCDYLGVEGGYFASSELSRDSFFTSGELSLGARVFGSTKTIASSRIQGWHMNAVGYVPFSDCYCLTALAYVGVSQSKITLKNIETEVDNLPFNLVNNFSQTKTILRAGFGIQYMITNCIGIRSILGWENTKKFNAITTNIDPNIVAKMKDSVLLSFGIFARF